MSKQISHHVVPNQDVGWEVKKAGAERASEHSETNQEAVEKGRQLSQNQVPELVILSKDGKIKKKDSHGNDPCLPKDKVKLYTHQHLNLCDRSINYLKGLKIIAK
jgi:hypothetical protein